jgi:hypothetical protein
VGWIWIVVAGLLADRNLYTRLPAHLPAGWNASVSETARHVVPRLGSPGLLAPAALWALAAAALPWFSRGPLALRVVLASAWAAGLASGTDALLRLGHAGAQAPTSAVVLGALAAWAVVMGPALVRRLPSGLRSADTAPGLA